MDAQAYLIRHGWSGPGNPLNPNSKHHPHGGLGLTRPILVSRKNNNHGVGKKTTKDPTNQWWLRGFEDALKGVGSEQRDNGGASSANALTSELYRFFVRGEVLEGTIRRECGHGQGAEGAMGDNNDGEKSGKGKRKRVDSDDEVKEAKMRKKEKKREDKKKKKDKEGVSSERCSSDEASKEDKEERRRRRKEEKRKRKAEDSKDGSKTKSSSKTEKKKKERRRRKETLISAEADYPTPASTEQEQTDSSGQDESAAIGKTLKEKKDKKHKKESKKSKKLKTDENADPGLSTSKEPKKAKKDKKDKKKKSTSD
ncbi:hypothetical protein MPDQ_001118 [Monascus purpureus]|uniref:Telomerase inhibitor n=1 Tax=Monascus purpureus TaxID=5098 RepID=A0A507QS80_MONPU|nr:hypothetical protein MPDQ_001118 [Monascus purpureus]BDD57324.1 hypothetical protein MAP00_002696 [Monascus purpureus]